MKKLNILLCAALSALAIVSCKQEPKVEPVIEPEQQLSNLSSTAVNLLKESDPNYWGEFAKSAILLFNDLKTVGDGNLGFRGVKGTIAEEEPYTLADDIENWFYSVVKGDHYTLYLTSVRLSLFTGDITVKEAPVGELRDDIEEGEETLREFVYTRSNNPLNLTFVSGDKTYKFQFEARDSENNIIKIKHRIDEWEEGESVVTEEVRQEIAVPSKVAIHITENGASFIDGVIEPEFMDLNWDNFANYSDEIRANGSLTVPGYSIKASNVQLNLNELEGKFELFHGNTSLLSIDGEINIDVPNAMPEDDDEVIAPEIRGKKAVAIPLEFISIALKVLTKVEGTVKLMGGSVVLDGTVYPQDLMKLMKESGSIYDEEDARAASSMIQRYMNVKLSYNDGSRVQSMLVCKPFKKEVDSASELEPKDAAPAWKWEFGLLFPDQTFMTFDELQESEEFDAVIAQAAIWYAHGDAIFGKTDSSAGPEER